MFHFHRIKKCIDYLHMKGFPCALVKYKYTRTHSGMLRRVICVGIDIIHFNCNLYLITTVNISLIAYGDILFKVC